ncbi:MAG: DUF4209 domain-containing protein [Kiloniellaceae bacterium]
MVSSVSLPSTDKILEALESAKKPTAHSYANAFKQRRHPEQEDGWGVLEQIFNFHFRPANPSEPFGPMAVFGDKRTWIPDDLSENLLSAIRATLQHIDPPEYRARILDILWLRQGDAKSAREAVNAYLKSGKLLEDPKHWVDSMERYERALRLARQIEPKGELPKEVLRHLEARVLHYNGSDPLYFTLNALELLEELRFGDFAALAQIAIRISDGAREAKDFERARKHLDIASKLFRRVGDVAATEEAKSAIVDCFVQEAEEREAGGSFMAAHSFWQSAIKAARESPAKRDRIPEFQARLSNAGKKMRDEMQSFSHEEDIGDQIRVSRDAMADLPWDDAFYKFASIAPLIDVTNLKKITEEQITKHPLQAMMAAEIFDAAGRKVGTRPSVATDDPKEYAAAISGMMEQNANIHRSFIVQAVLAPALRQMTAEHSIDEEAVGSILNDSGIVPDSRSPLVVRGVLAGFEWDFSTALHILVPQTENALRYALEQRGVEPVNIDASGVEEVWGYERLLNHDATREFLGEDFTYELRSMLVERLGPNMRNLLAHGLLSPESLQSQDAVYLWWLLLRLFAYPTSGMAAYVERRRSETPST